MIRQCQIDSVVTVGILIAVMVGFTTGCTTPTEAECDPTNDAFLNSLKCRIQYQNRQEKLEEEVRKAAERALQKEQKLADLENRHKAMNKQLETLQRNLTARQQRISALQSEQGATQVQLAELQAKWDKVKQNTDGLKARQSQVHATAQVNQFDAFDVQLAELREEEAELEALLLDLES